MEAVRGGLPPRNLDVPPTLRLFESFDHGVHTAFAELLAEGVQRRLLEGRQKQHFGAHLKAIVGLKSSLRIT